MLSPEFLREYYLNKMARSNWWQKHKEEKIKELEKINSIIKRAEDNCGHEMIVNLGYDEFDCSTGSKCRCLICGKVKEGQSLDESKYIIHAENYLPQYDITNNEQCSHKYDLIKTLAYGLWEEKVYASEEEFVNELNNMIQESISLKKEQSGPALIKKQLHQ